MHDAAPMLREGALLLGFALAFVLLFRRFGLGAVLGYLVAGVVVGPHVLGLVGDAQSKLDIAELGITLLLFLVGLELDPSKLWRLRREIFGFGGAQVVLCGAAVALLVWLVAGFSPAAALAIGLPLGLSSTAQVLPMLQSAGRLRTPFGERAFSILLFQDLSIVPLITVVAALSRAPAAADAPPGWVLALYTVGAVVGLVAAGRFVLTPLFRLIGSWGEREMFVFAGLFTVLAAAALMDWLGLSTALGAFVAGMMLADGPFRHEIEADVDPFRSVLLGLFFVAVGMMLDVPAILDRPVFVVGMAALLIAAKTAIITGIAMLARMRWRRALALGLLLSQGGEFGFVLFAQAQSALLIAPEAASLFGAVVTLSMATTPFLMIATRRLRAEPVADGGTREAPRRDGARAIVVGHGRFGQTVSQMLRGQGIGVSIVESDPGTIDVAGDFGIKVYYGDGTRLDLLRRAGAQEAELLLFCIDGTALDAETLHAVAAAFPDAALFVRAYDRRHLMAIGAAPVAGTVRDVFESALAMARDAMASLGVDGTQIADTEQRYRDLDRARLRRQMEAGDIYAGRGLTPTGAPVEETA